MTSQPSHFTQAARVACASQEHCVQPARPLWVMGGDEPPRAPTGRPASLKTSGELKLSLVMDGDRLTVHVIEARHLNSRWKNVCDSYVQVLLIPRRMQQDCSETRVIPSSNNPQYNEKFTFELMEGDKRKRIMVSLWHKDNVKNCSEFMGCMSFGLKHLTCKHKAKKSESWYYLLSENVGHRKHLASQPCHNRTQNKENSAAYSKMIAPKDCIMLVVVRSASGYGFTVRGACPVRVGRVRRRGAGEGAGLRRGDVIVAVNQHSVLEASAEQAASLVRYSPYQVVLSIHRPSRVISGSRGASEPCPSDQPPGQAEGGSQGHPLRSQPRGGSLGHPLRSQPQGQSVEELPADRTRWDPELSSVAACMSPTGSEASLEGSSSGCGTSVSPHSSDAPGAPPQRGQAGRPRGTASSHSTGVSSAEEDELDDTSDMQHWHRPGGDLGQRAEAVRRLVWCERQFVAEMQHGMLQFSRPLRHCIISPHQHVIIFQNIEKLVAISEFHIDQLIDTSRHSNTLDLSHFNEIFVQSIGSVYQPKVKMLCAAYEAYQNGLQVALQMLLTLRDYKQLRHFLQTATETSEYLDIEGFLNKPLQHIKDLCECLENVLLSTPSQHSDHPNLMELIQVLSGSGEKSTDTGSGDWTSEEEGSLSLPAGWDTSSGEASALSGGSGEAGGRVVPYPHSVPSVDPELMQLQQRLSFAKGIKRLPVAVAGRHLVFSGDVLQRAGGGWRAVHALLLSDVMLVTQRRVTPRHRLAVIERPLPLRDVITAQFNCDNPLEFMLTVDHLCTTSSIRREAKHYVFRAPSMEEKCAWKTIVEHRVRVCKAQPDAALEPRGEVFI